jgi:serine/threonine-protein kinase
VAVSVPARLGRYQVLQHLASGGMAQLSLARDGSTGRHVVLKRIRGEQAMDPKLVKMFLDEAQLAMALHHPNIVEVFDVGSAADEYYFAMEYVHGEDLRNVLMRIHERRDLLPITQVMTLVAAAAAGLHHAHELCDAGGHPLGIVHRDVSPANILVAYDGSVKVTDFGIAKATLHTAETRSGVLKGKVSYMSPEQVTGADIDRRSDVFALGIVFYEVATARRLFKNENDFLTMSSIVQCEIPPPTLHRPDLPVAIEKMIMKALASNPKERFSSARELHEEIERFLRSLGQQTSQRSVADYMKKLFGYRPEPWLTEDAITQTEPLTVDFDGSDSGIVTPPPGAMNRLALPRRSDPESLIARARDAVIQDPMLKTTVHQVPSAPRSRRWAIRGGAAALAAFLFVLIAIKLTSNATTTAPTPPAEATAIAPAPPIAPPPPPVSPPPPQPVAPPPAPPTPPPAAASPPQPAPPVAVSAPAPAHRAKAVARGVTPKPSPKPDKKPPAPAWDPDAFAAPK